MSDCREELFQTYATMVTVSQVGCADPQAAAKQFRHRWQRHLPKDRAAVILDLGCGSGEWLWCLQSLGYKKLYGVDLCQESLQAARALGLPNTVRGNAVDFVEGRSEQFDLISAFNFCEHLPKPEVVRLLRSVFSALKPGGAFLAVTPNGLSPFGGATRYWDITHELAFTPASWRQLARLTGFARADFEEYGPLAHSFRGVVRAGLWQLVKLVFDGVSYIEVARPRDSSRVYTADMKIILRKAARNSASG